MGIAEKVFDAIPEVRYVAVYSDGALFHAQRPGLSDASESETDRYEELFVNPAVLTLTQQRGKLDCGGLKYVLIRYGRFFQFVTPISGGHASVAVSPDSDIGCVVGQLEDFFRHAKGQLGRLD